MWIDEKLFTVEQSFNRQNDRILATSLQEVNDRGRINDGMAHPAAVMVWCGVTEDHKTDLIFVEQGVKISADNYIADILDPLFDDWVPKHYPNGDFLFQQDSAPAHCAKKTQQ